MCVEAMDTATPKRMKTSCLRKTAAWKLQWRLLRASATADEDEARKESRAAAAIIIRDPLRRQRRRAQLVKLARALGDASRDESKTTTTTPAVESKPLPYVHRHHPGAMAPENTTQYLMSNTYEDLCGQDGGAMTAAEAYSPYSPRSVCSALDFDYDTCLAFQQRDFEEEFGDLFWGQ